MYTLDAIQEVPHLHQQRALDEINLIANLPTTAGNIKEVSRGWVITDLFDDNFLLTQNVEPSDNGFAIVYRVYSAYGDLLSCFQSEILLECL